ncbi:hypothetical protein CASFOL_017695 [Castilleja foliolosa]|uniref:Uncharacterized protein n=1 Tax=Castilleja foliolosa TaxID=1961234 RepID=A0ABD3D8Z2_9LAMI
MWSYDYWLKWLVLAGQVTEELKSTFQAVNVFKKTVNVSGTREATHVCKEYDESSTKLSKLQLRISNLEHKLKQDFGQGILFILWSMF